MFPHEVTAEVSTCVGGPVGCGFFLLLLLLCSLPGCTCFPKSAGMAPGIARRWFTAEENPKPPGGRRGKAHITQASSFSGALRANRNTLRGAFGKSSPCIPGGGALVLFASHLYLLASRRHMVKDNKTWPEDVYLILHGKRPRKFKEVVKAKCKFELFVKTY